MSKYTPSSGSDFDGWYASNCDHCSKERRCKHIANSMLVDKPYEVDEHNNCVYIKPFGTKNNPTVDKNQLDLFE